MVLRSGHTDQPLFFELDLKKFFKKVICYQYDYLLI